MLTIVERRLGFWNDGPGTQLADLTTFRYNGDVLAMTAILLSGGVTSGLLVPALLWLERLEAPSPLDHLRHCAALYTLLVVLVYGLIASYEDQAAHGTSLGYGVAVIAFLAVGYAIMVDALVLRRRSYAQTSSGSGA